MVRQEVHTISIGNACAFSTDPHPKCIWQINYTGYKLISSKPVLVVLTVSMVLAVLHDQVSHGFDHRYLVMQRLFSCTYVFGGLDVDGFRGLDVDDFGGLHAWFACMVCMVCMISWL